MSDPNPYAPPKAAVADYVEAGPDILASRGQRLGAAVLDSLVSMVWGLPLWYLFGVWATVMHGQRPSIGTTLLLTVIGFALFTAVNFNFLQKNGQTIGKKLVGVRIATLEGGIPDVWRVLGLRYGTLTLLALVPYVGSLIAFVDVLLIFRGDRRCLHDLIAGTKVLRA